MTLTNKPNRGVQVVILGDLITDIIARQTEPLEKASDTRTRIDICAGGSAANLATWLAMTGRTVHFIGRVGQDPFGFYHQEELRKFGVTPHLSFDPQLSTGAIVVIVDAAGERHMLTDRGANQNLALPDIPWEVFTAENCFHLSGYTLLETGTREVALKALEKARQEGMVISVDPSSTSLLREIGPERFLDWTRGAQLCFPNLDEGRLLSAETDPAAVTQRLAEWYGEVVLKLGAAGATWARKGEAVVSVPAFAVEVMDSTGAGDAFCAGFLGEWLKGAPPSEALSAGTRLGAQVASQAGARPLKLERKRAPWNLSR